MSCDGVKTKGVLTCLLKPMFLILGTQGFPVTAGGAALPVEGKRCGGLDLSDHSEDLSFGRHRICLKGVRDAGVQEYEGCVDRFIEEFLRGQGVGRELEDVFFFFDFGRNLGLFV